MKKLTCTGALIILGTTVMQAQTRDANEMGLWTDSVITPQFFIAVIAGVLLALGFQFLLTALSVAAGITAIGDIKEKYVKGKYHPNRKDNLHDVKHDVENNDDDDDDSMDTGTMVTTAFGVWSVITTVLALFGATALAINLALIASPVIAITLGLVIWATFFILLFYLESLVVSSLVGGLIATATSGLRASGEAVKSMFQTSKETQLKNVAEDTVDKIRKDFQAVIDPDAINESIDDFFTRVDKSVPDYEKVKKDIRKIIEESDERSREITEEHDERSREIAKESDKRQEKIQKKHGGGGQGKWMAINNVLSNAISEGGKEGGDQSKVEQLKKLQQELKAAYDEGDTNEEKLEKAVAKLTDKEEEEVHGYIEKLKGILAKATPEDMDQGKIQEKVMQVFQNPKVEGPKLLSKIGELDRKTIISVLSQNTALDKAQIEKYADKVEKVIQQVKDKIQSMTSGGGGDFDFGDMKLKVEKEIFKLMNQSGKPELNFSMLTSYFQKKFSGQGEGDTLQNWKKKLTNLDKDSFLEIVKNNTNVDQKDIDKVVQSYEDAKNKVLQQIQEIEDEANRRVENLKRKAVIQAENTRANAAAAAWWLVGSAVLSAGAAILGSLLALG